MTQIAVRLPDRLVRQLDALIPEPHGTRSDAVRQALEIYVYRMACERDAERYAAVPFTDAELVLADDPSGWEGTAPW